MAGSIDNIDGGVIAGWALDPQRPSTRLLVRLAIGESNVATAEASQFRKDLLDAGKGDGKCAFAIKLSDADWRRVLDQHREVSITAHDPTNGALFDLPASQRVRQFLECGDTRATLLRDSSPARVQLTAVCIIKNEAHYVEEWIAYHLIKGVQFFLFFDNGSTDNLREVLAPYVERGIAQVIIWPNFIEEPAIRRTAWHEQNVAYLHAVRSLAYISEWVVVLDIDEFIVTNEHTSVTELLAQMQERDAVTLYWRVFGSAGHETRPAGLVVESFTCRANDAIQDGMPFKFMVRPEKVGWIVNTHLAYMAADRALGQNTSGSRFWTIRSAQKAADYSTMWINHYHVKSKEEYRAKVIRGWPQNTDNKNFNWEGFFSLHDRNEVEDRTLVDFGADIQVLIARMKQRSARQSATMDWYRTLILAWELTSKDDQIVVAGIALDCAEPGARVRLEVQDVFCNTIYQGVCADLSVLAVDYDFCDGRMGFNISLPRNRFPFNQLRILLNGVAFSRSIPRQLTV